MTQDSTDPSISQFKAQAARLRGHLGGQDLDLPLTAVYEALSQALYGRPWNTARVQMLAQSDDADTAAVLRMSAGECRAVLMDESGQTNATVNVTMKAQAYSVVVDLAPFFLTAGLQELAWFFRVDEEGVFLDGLTMKRAGTCALIDRCLWEVDPFNGSIPFDEVAVHLRPTTRGDVLQLFKAFRPADYYAAVQMLTKQYKQLDGHVLNADGGVRKFNTGWGWVSQDGNRVSHEPYANRTAAMVAFTDDWMRSRLELFPEHRRVAGVIPFSGRYR